MIRAFAMTPLWTAQLACATKSFADNRVIGSALLNRLGLHAARVRAAHRLARRRRRHLAAAPGAIDPADREAFERDGFVIREGFLPADGFARRFDWSVQRRKGYRYRDRALQRDD